MMYIDETGDDPEDSIITIASPPKLLEKSASYEDSSDFEAGTMVNPDSPIFDTAPRFDVLHSITIIPIPNITPTKDITHNQVVTELIPIVEDNSITDRRKSFSVECTKINYIFLILLIAGLYINSTKKVDSPTELVKEHHRALGSSDGKIYMASSTSPINKSPIQKTKSLSVVDLNTRSKSPSFGTFDICFFLKCKRAIFR